MNTPQLHRPTSQLHRPTSKPHSGADSAPPARRRAPRRATRVLVGLASTLLMLAAPGFTASAGAEVRIPLASPQAPLEDYPAKADWQCSPTFRSGSERFANLLMDITDHRYSYGGARSCGASNGAARSYHKTGLAVDFMMDSRDPAVRADGVRILEWLFAAEGGQPHANLRRLGIVEIIWDGHMWSAERDRHITTPDPATWPAYSGLGCAQSPSQGTACHYDHFHFTLSEAAGAGLNSFWSGPVHMHDPVSYFVGFKARYIVGEPVFR